MSLDCISSFQADINIYTDGSTNKDQENGGAGVHIESDGVEIAAIIKPAGKYCASYGGEIVALLEAMKWIEKAERECIHQLTILIATDSKSLTDAMRNPDWKNSEYA
jgi:ribonuclease HI